SPSARTIYVRMALELQKGGRAANGFTRWRPEAKAARVTRDIHVAGRFAWTLASAVICAVRLSILAFTCTNSSKAHVAQTGGLSLSVERFSKVQSSRIQSRESKCRRPSWSVGLLVLLVITASEGHAATASCAIVDTIGINWPLANNTSTPVLGEQPGQ